MNQRHAFKLVVAAVFTILNIMVLQAHAERERYLRLVTGDISSREFEATGELVKKLSAGDGFVASSSASPTAEAAQRVLKIGGADVAVLPPELAADSGFSTLASLDHQPFLILVRRDRHPASVLELTGWRLALGPRSSETFRHNVFMLSALGLSRGSYRVVGGMDMETRLRHVLANRADATVVEGEMDATALEALRTGRLAVLEPAKGELDRALRRNVFLSRTVVTIPPDSNVATVSSAPALMASAALPEETARDILTRLALPAKAADNPPTPLHPAAKAFFPDAQETEDTLYARP